MNGPIPELWSPADVAARDALEHAIRDDDLLAGLLAVEGADDDARHAVRTEVASLVDRARELLLAGHPPHEALRVVLADEAGLTGDVADYDHPDNSLVSRVLARRRGLPILVSSLWVAIARAAGADAAGVALPGHYVARVGTQLVDPFAGGAPLDDEGLARILATFAPGRPADPAWLADATTRATLDRVLRNLARSCGARHDDLGAYRALRLLATAAPDDAVVHLEVARLTEGFGADALAAQLYERLAKRFEGRREGQIAAIRVVELGSRSRTLN
ncbi:MAG: hypothetical protein H6745_23685 [Deltaproteobacteria bacterium]|nr:hypothetical protein [Deltaproteobacteria bacterium]